MLDLPKGTFSVAVIKGWSFFREFMFSQAIYDANERSMTNGFGSIISINMRG
jgi:hypothetical protein